MEISRIGILLTILVAVRAEDARTVDTSCRAPWPSTSTLCQYENDDDPSVKDKGVSEEDIQLILDEHNRYRAAVDPPAKQMQKMYWSNELEMVAQKWAQTCARKHDSFDNRAIPGWSLPIGQNSAFGHGSWSKAIKGWHEEVELFTYGMQYNKTSIPPWNKIGHYTQVVRDLSVLVGCGYARCGRTRIHFCNYAYTNIQGKIGLPYVKGPSCAGCPGHCSNNLCDCNGLLCKNGKLDPKTCTCNCKNKYWTGENCGTKACGGLQCKNRGKFDPDKCTCACRKMWTGNDCSILDRTKCVVRPRRKCPKVCGVCTPK